MTPRVVGFLVGSAAVIVAVGVVLWEGKPDTAFSVAIGGLVGVIIATAMGRG